MRFIAIRMLTAERSKYLGLVFAIGFCTFLLQNQMSIFAGILKRTGSQISDITEASVWVMDPKTEYFEQTKALKDTDLLRVRGVAGVDWAVRLFKGNPIAKTESGKYAATTMIGIDDDTLIGAPRKMLLGRWQDLEQPDSVIVDRAGYMLLYPGEREFLGRTIELNDRRVTIVGISDASPSFLSLPIMHARYSEALQFQGQERKQLSFVLAKPVKGVSPEDLCRRIESATGLRARTTDQFRWDCIRYYLKNTGIPVNFGITIMIALVVGTVVAGQTFYLFTIDNLRQFGTLKAIGVGNGTLVWMILLQALMAASIGFSIGTGMEVGFVEIFLHKIATRGLILIWQAVGIAAACIVFVVVVASWLSIRKVLRLEAATVFRS
jgi:putative ABC transport system permease protein